MSFQSNKSKNKSSQTSQGTSTTTIDPWSKSQFENQTAGILGTAQGTLDRTLQYTNQPFKAYNSPMVAGMSANEQQAYKMAQDGSGSGGILNDAVAATNAGAEGVLGPDKVNYRTFDPSRIEARQNPYQRDVVDAAGAYYDEQLGKRMSENQAAAQKQGAYGGSRHGIADAELQRTSNMDRAQLMSDLKYKGWNDAVAADAQETQGVFGADQYNSSAGYQGRVDNANRKFTAAGILSGLAGQKDASFAQQADMLAKSGATAREIEQAQLLASRAEFDRSAKDELDKLMLELQARQGYQQTQQGILSSTPFGQTTTSSGSGTSSGTTTSSGLSFSAGFGPKGFSFGG